MPIFIKTESKSVKGRLFHACTFVLLSLGGITMIYPFLLMISGAFRSAMDEADLNLVPAYFVEEESLYQKFLEFKYNQDVSTLNRAHLQRNRGFQFAKEPRRIDEAKIGDYYAFVEEVDLPVYWKRLGGMSTQGTVQENKRKYRKLVAEKAGTVERFSRMVGAFVGNWGEVTFPPPDWVTSRTSMDDNILFESYFELLNQVPIAEWSPVSLSGYFLEVIAYPRFGNVEDFNAETRLNLASFKDFRLPRRAPDKESQYYRDLWREFVLYDLNLSFVLVEDLPAVDFQNFLREFYQGDINELNLVWESDFHNFSEISLPTGDFLPGGFRRDYLEFLEGVETEHLALIGPEFTWREWLKENYTTLQDLNDAYGTNYTSWEQIWMPLSQMEMEFALANSGSLRWQFATRNFINVFDAIFVEGRVFANTVIFTSLSVLLAILINPLAAYAMSRFNLPGTYKILLLMMAVMAFPPMVTTIPTFIMMQNLGLMNTFAGLLLPTIANGYLIYLLKGFFDSLPKELYEAAQLEGASEFKMFFSITMALSKPILAVVGLTAFNSAYTVFLFALIIAPDQDMWLLPVWLYQYRETVSMGGVFASVLIASIPPIVVFIFAQNIILRGIVVPVEK